MRAGISFRFQRRSNCTCTCNAFPFISPLTNCRAPTSDAEDENDIRINVKTNVCVCISVTFAHIFLHCASWRLALTSLFAAKFAWFPVSSWRPPSTSIPFSTVTKKNWEINMEKTAKWNRNHFMCGIFLVWSFWHARIKWKRCEWMSTRREHSVRRHVSSCRYVEEVDVVPVSHTHTNTPAVEKYKSGKLCERMAEVRAVCKSEYAFVMSFNGRIQRRTSAQTVIFLLLLLIACDN